MRQRVINALTCNCLFILWYLIIERPTLTFNQDAPVLVLIIEFVFCIILTIWNAFVILTEYDHVKGVLAVAHQLTSLLMLLFLCHVVLSLKVALV